MKLPKNFIPLDYETDSLYFVRIKSTDLDGLTVEKPIIIAIANVNEKPDSLIMSNDTILEQAPGDTLAETYSTRDPDLFGKSIYPLVEGKGTNDNSKFYVDGDLLYSNEVFISDEKDIRLIRELMS
ncbi:MAG: hypothetical protein ACI93L_001942 [Cyclobacteriaceae bacterium]